MFNNFQSEKDHVNDLCSTECFNVYAKNLQTRFGNTYGICHCGNLLISGSSSAVVSWECISDVIESETRLNTTEHFTTVIMEF